MADDAKRLTFRIVHAYAAQAAAVANELAEDYVLSNINFYVLEGEEKVAMLFVRKAPVASSLPPGAIIRR
jgi:hypothetical protein